MLLSELTRLVRVREYTPLEIRTLEALFGLDGKVVVTAQNRKWPSMKYEGLERPAPQVIGTCL